MLLQNTALINDFKGVMNKLNDHNNKTVDIFSNMKKQVLFFNTTYYRKH